MTAADDAPLFARGSKPVMRWIKGDGLDDVVTRSALAQATRLFGASVDYCLCTHGLPASRVRRVLAWAKRPVEWYPLTPEANPRLAQALQSAGCDSDHFGYWWKWFPERVRPDAPEWILDGDMVVVRAPHWFGRWHAGTDVLRVSQDDRWPIKDLYGEYVGRADATLRLYSGLISLPPQQGYLEAMLSVLRQQPLKPGHNGCVNMSEQGVVAAAFSALQARPIPLFEFPFGRAFEPALDYGLLGRCGPVWGYHFGNAFRHDNPHFRRLVDEKVIDGQADDGPPQQRLTWLQNWGSWGRPGWSMEPTCVARIATLATAFAGRPVLELGTSRGYLSAILASAGCRVTTVDAADRGAAQNLDGLDVRVIRADAHAHLKADAQQYDFIVVDMDGNSEPAWRERWPLLRPRLAANGTLVLYNSHLDAIEEWREENGLRWVHETQLTDFTVDVFETPAPGMLVCRARG